MPKQYSPYLGCVSVLATWLRIRIFMGVIVISLLILMILSGYTTQVADGGYGVSVDLTFASWSEKVCEASPMIYLRPFSFTYTIGGAVSSTSSKCPWPVTNTAFRFIVTIISFFLILALYVKSILSKFGRTIFLIYALLFFACFILDTNQAVVGSAACVLMFKDTPLGNSLVQHGATVTCSDSANALVIIIDLVLTVMFYVCFECWGMCPDLYNILDDQIIPKQQRVETTTSNPIHAGNGKKNIVHDGVDYTPYTHSDTTDYSPYEKVDTNVYEPYEKVNGADDHPHSVEAGTANATAPRKRAPPPPAAAAAAPHKESQCFLL